jgi:protein-S-isoprenylcysteine O-methyltransferase Ste14
MSVSQALLRDAIPAMWAAWIVYWLVAARDVKPTSWRESPAANALHGIPLLLSLLLLAAPRWLPAVLTRRLVPPSLALPLFGTALVAAGLLFAVWARVCLGRNWSGRVEVKEDHALVRTGPYRLVRHPIYSGMLLALAGTACAIGEWRGVLAFLCALAGILLRVRVEEARMRATFPEYEEYRRHSWALLPPLF